MAEKHRLSGDSNQNSGISQQIQSSIEFAKVSRVLENKIDAAITKYIVMGILPHAHVESLEFKEFIHQIVPGYQVKTRHTVYGTYFSVGHQVSFRGYLTLNRKVENNSLDYKI